MIGVEQCAHARRIENAASLIDAPVVDGNGNIEQPGIAAGKLKIE
jgi:hypothetical protein